MSLEATAVNSSRGKTGIDLVLEDVKIRRVYRIEQVKKRFKTGSQAQYSFYSFKNPYSYTFGSIFRASVFIVVRRQAISSL